MARKIIKQYKGDIGFPCGLLMFGGGAWKKDNFSFPIKSITYDPSATEPVKIVYETESDYERRKGDRRK